MILQLPLCAEPHRTAIASLLSAFPPRGVCVLLAFAPAAKHPYTRRYTSRAAAVWAVEGLRRRPALSVIAYTSAEGDRIVRLEDARTRVWWLTQAGDAWVLGSHVVLDDEREAEA